MVNKLLFQDLPDQLQDELRDAPIAEISDGKVVVEAMGKIHGILHYLSVELKPRSMDADSIIYVSQDLQDIEVSAFPIRQSLPA